MVIDPISYLYALSKRGNGDLFSETRQMLFPLRWLGKQHQCAIVALDHRRKRSRDDTNVFDTLHGSIAKQAIADALLMVERDDEDITLAALVRRGKDATHHLTMQFKDGRCWLDHKGTSPPNTGQTNYSELRQKVIMTLQQSKNPLAIADILAILEIPKTKQTTDQVYQMLARAMKAGEVQRTNLNAYVLSRQEE